MSFQGGSLAFLRLPQLKKRQPAPTKVRKPHHHHLLAGLGFVWTVLRRCVRGGLLVATLRYVSNRAERKAMSKWRAEALATLATASDADIRLLLKELPPWVISGEQIARPFASGNRQMLCGTAWP